MLLTWQLILNLETKRRYKVFDCTDIQVEISPVPFDEISNATPGEPSSAIRERFITET